MLVNEAFDTIIFTSSDAEHPVSSVTNTVYVVLIEGFTFGFALVLPEMMPLNGVHE